MRALATGAPKRARARHSRALGRLVTSFVLATAFLAVGVPAQVANAFEIPTANWSTTSPNASVTTPSGVTISVAGTGSTTNNGTATAGARGWDASQYSPTLVTGDSVTSPLVNTGSCASTGTCSGLGTMTINFSQPVRNPVLHISGMGGSFANGNSQSDIHAILDLTTSGVTLSKLAGNSQFAVSSTRITGTSGSASPSCTSLTNGNFSSTATAGCGSVQVDGTVTSLTFSMSAVLVKNPSATAAYNGSGSGDAFGLTVTLPQDFSDAPTSYNASQAPAHVIGDLRLGSTLPDEENPNTRNATASPFGSAAANGDDTTGTDDEDAFSSTPPNLLSGVANTYSLSVPLSGVSKSARVCGYIDLNKGGTFDTSTERACATVSAGATSADLSWSAPATTTAGNSFARFRVAYTAADAESPTGVADSGEVEDYVIWFAGRPTITLNKITLGASGGPFGFTLTNTTQTSGTVTTTAAGTAVQVDGDTGSTGTQAFTAAAINTAVTINETTIPTGWALSSATCTNAAGATVGSLSGSTYTLPAGEMTPGAALTCTYRNGQPSIGLTKSAGSISTGANGPFAGDTIPYTFTVTNTGQTPLSSIAITDAKVGTVTCAATSLGIGASTTCSASYQLTQADINSGQVVNNATVSGTPPTGPAVTAPATATKTIPQNPAIDLAKTAGPVTDVDGNGHDVGDTVTYSFKVTNTGNVSLASVGINDPALGTVTCPTTSLAPGAATTCTKTYTLTQTDVDAGQVSNTATASGTPPTGTAVTDTDSASRTITRTASLTLDKTAGTPSGTGAGATIAYSFLVTNTGNTTLTAVQVNDPKVGSVSCPVAPLAPGAATTCTKTYTLTQADVNAGQVYNSASATATPPAGVTAPTAGDTLTVVLPRSLSISLDKQTAGITDLDGNGPDAGDRLNYSFLVTNTGNVTLDPVTVSDPKVPTVSCPLTSLAPAASTTCTGGYTLTQADFDSGAVYNTATASGVGPAGTWTVTATDTNASPLTAGPSLSLDKRAGTLSGSTVGSTLGFTFVVTNTGNVTMNGIWLADNKVAVSCPQSSLAPGGSMTCAATYTVVQADVDAGAVVNSATVTGYSAANGQAASATDGTTTPIAANPSITLDKQVGTPSGATAGSTVPYSFVVVNTGNVTLSGIHITDANAGSLTCPTTTLAAGATTTCTGTHVLTQADIDAGHVANTATVAGNPPTGAAVTANDSTDLTITRTAAITIDKQAGPPSGSSAGSTIAYSFVVTNTGNTTLTGVAVSDPKVGTVTCPVSTLLPGASTTCAATYPITQADVDAGVVDNTASATGTPPAGLTKPTASDSTTTTLTRTSGITIDKQAGTPSGATAGSTIAYSFVVTNTGNTTLTGVGVSDAKVGTVTCPTTTLAPGATTTCTGTYGLTQSDVDAGSVVNNASATGTPPAGVTPPTATDSTTTTITPAPKLTLTKTAGTPSGTGAGSTIAYTFVVKNTGNVTLHAVAVTDPLVASVTCPVSTLAPGASTSCTGTHTLTQAEVDAGTITNTATAAGTPPTGSPVTATGATTTPLPRTASITVDKQAGTPTGNTVGSTIAYTFIVRNTGNVTLTSVHVTDPKVGAPTCAQTTLAPGATTTCTASYTLTQADIDAGHVANTATATGTPPTGLTAPTATDSTDTTVAQNPRLSLDKVAGLPSGTTAGSTIAYTFAVVNTGNVTLTSVHVTDPKVGTVTCPDTSLAPGAGTTCTATYTLTQTDVDAGHVANNATASGTGPSGTEAKATDATDTTISSGPALSLDKQDSTPTGNTPGATITYTFVVTNTGNVTLSGIALSDPKLGAVDCSAASLAPGAHLDCTATYVLTQADIDAGKVENSATASGTSPGGSQVSATDQTSTAITTTPALTLDKQAGTPTGNAAGSTIAYTFVVTNTGNVTLTGVQVTDPKVTPVACAVTSLAPGASTTCTGTHTITQAEVDAGHVANSATATGTTQGGATPSATDTTDTPIAPAPGITVDKQAGTPSGTSAGSTIAYTFVVTNTGNTTLTGVQVGDPKVGAVTCPATTLAPGKATTCTATYTLTQADVDAGQVANTATVTGTPPTGAPVTGTDTVTTPLTRTAALTLAKTAGTPTGNHAGDTVPYTFVVTNTGNTTLTGVQVADPNVSAVTCPVTTLAPGAATTCTATHVITQAEVDAGVVANTATAGATPPAGVTPPSATDSDTVSLGRAPALTLDKQTGGIADANSDGMQNAGDTIAYTFLVQNTGNTTLSSVAVDDPKVGTVTCPVTTLAPGETTSCAATYTLTQADVNAGSVTNTAEASGTAAGTTVTASDTVVVPIEAGPELTLDKQAGAPSGNVAGSTIAYTFVLANTGNVDLTGIAIVDPTVGAVTCPQDTLAVGATITCHATYVLTQADVDAGLVTNTATASGQPPVGAPVDAADGTTVEIPRATSIAVEKTAGTPSGYAAGDTVPYSFTVTNTGTTTLTGVQVTDPLVGAVTCLASTLAPGTATTCAATYTLTQVDVDAGHVANAATATGTPPVGLTPPTASDTTDTPLTPNPVITVDKRPGTLSGTAAGATLPFTFVVTNAGTVTLTSISIDDPKVGAVTCPVTTLAPGASTTCAATYTLTQADVDAGHVANHATVSGTSPDATTVTADDSTDTTVGAAPAITLDKQGSAPSTDMVGGTISYTFVVTNTGNVTLSGVQVTDPRAGTVTCPQATLAPGAHIECTASYPLAQADIDSGHVDNTATAAGTSPGGAVVTATDSVSTPIAARPGVAMDKQAGVPSGQEAGDTIDYTFVVSNTGNVTLSLISVTDIRTGAVSCGVTTLLPTESTTCHATYTLLQSDVDAGHVDNSATVTATTPNGTITTGTDGTSTAIPDRAGIALDKQAGTPSGNTAGATIGYTFVVSNTGNVTLSAVGITDPLVGAVTCPVTTVAPGASVTCSATYTLTQADVDAGVVDNTATAAGTTPGDVVLDAEDSTSTVIPAAPKVALDKQAGTPSGATAGSTIAYTFRVVNTGNVTLTSVGITDLKVGTVTCPVATLAPGAETTCSATYVLTQADVDAGHVANTAAASGNPPTGPPATASDSTDTPVAADAVLTLDKQAGAPSGDQAGDTIAYTFLVTNHGNVTLHAVAVSDPLVGTVTCPDTTLAPGASTTCTATYLLTQADVDAGHVDNAATASGTTPGGAEVTAGDSTSTPIPPRATLSLDKQAGTLSGNTAGSTIDYTFVLVNTGNVTLHDVAVSDPKVGPVSCPAATLAPGASIECTATYTLTQADIDAGHAANTATAWGTPPAGGPVSATDNTDTVILTGPVIDVEKTAGTPSGNAAGDTIAYSFLVTNRGNVTLHAVAVADPLVGTVACPVTSLAPGEATTCTATYTLTQADVDAGHVDNTATASGTSPTSVTVTADDTVSTPIDAAPAITVDKRAGLPSGNGAGSSIAYEFVVVNTGNVTLASVGVDDPKVGAVSCPATTLAPGASTTCTATYTLTQADVDAGHVANTATVSGTPPTGAPVTGTDSTDTAIAAGPGITLDKRAGVPSGNEAGDTIAYGFEVANTGNVTLTAISIDDPKVGAVTCPVTSLAPGAHTTCTATYTLTQADVDAGVVDNSATVSGTPPTGAALTASDSTSSPISSAPAVSVDKRAGLPSGNVAGGTIAYEFVVVNTGNVTLSAIAIDDPKVGAVACPDTTLAPGATTTCTVTYTLSQADVDAGHVANTATVSGTPPTGSPVTGTDSTDTTIASGPALTLVKTAGAPSGNRVGDTIGYEFLVTNTGNVTLGTIGVTDAKVGTVACPVTSLAPGLATTCTATYTLTQADVDAGHVDNTATASGTPPTGAPVTVDDSVSTPISSAPAITVDKRAGLPSGSRVGDTIAYEFVVVNTGNVTLASVGVDDPLVGTVSCPDTTLAPGADTTCTATYTLTQADVDSGHVANTATASGTPPTGGAVTGTDSTDTTIAAGPALTLAKTAGTPSGNRVGDTIAYEFLVTNTGNVTLTSVGVDDPKVGTVACPDATLAPGASTTCTATYTLTQADVDTGRVDNTATASGTPPTGAPVTADDTVSSPIDSAPAITVDKRAGLPSGDQAGATIAYEFVVANTGNVTLSAISIDDPLVGTVSCPDTTLAPGASTTCTATYTLTQADVDSGHVANTATVSGTPPTGAAVTSGDSTDTTIDAGPALTLAKTAGTPSGNRVGDTIAYEFLVTNTGNVTLTSVGVDDPKVGTVSCPDATLAPGASTTCTATYTLTQADVDAGVVDNTATASGTPPTGAPVTVEDSVSSPISAAPSVTVDKQAGVPSGNDEGDTIAYEFVVVNTGNVTLTSVEVDDPKVGTVDCPATTLAPGASTTCTATYTLTQADVDAGHVANTATVSGTPPTGASVTGTDSTDTTIDAGPALTLAKTAGTPSGNRVGDTIAYEFLMTNTGNVTLTSVGVDDPKVGTVSCPDTTLAPGASTTCTATYTLTQADVDAGVVDNTATASGTPPTGAPVTADDSVSSPISAAPSVTVDKRAGLPSGNAAGDTIAYEFVVVNTGNVTLASVGVDDPKVGTVSCPDTTLAPGASTTCTATYPLTQADVDAGHVANTATASGTPPTGAPVTGTDTTDTPIESGPALALDKRAGALGSPNAGETIAYEFEVTNTGNVTLTTISVDDPLVGAVTCPVTTLAPGTAAICTASYTVTQADVDAGTVDNTATASGLPPTGLAVDATDSTNTPIAALPTLELVKRSGAPSDNTAGSTIDYEFEVTNTGNVTLDPIRVSDPKVGAVDCPVTALAPSASTTCTATYTLTQADVDAGQVENTATGFGNPPAGDPDDPADDATDTSSVTTPVLASPGIDLVKTGTARGFRAGDAVDYEFVVTNTGNVTLDPVSVSDPLVGTVDCPVTSLAPGAHTTCTATYTLTQADVEAGTVHNEATASGTAPSGAVVEGGDQVDVPIEPGPFISLDKEAGVPSGTGAGSTIEYTFLVTNAGNVNLRDVTVEDPTIGALTCPRDELGPDESMQCTATYVITQADVDAGIVVNEATVTGTPRTGDPVTDSDVVTTPLAQLPGIGLVKGADVTSEVSKGDEVNYTFVVTNTGNVTLTGITLTDPMLTGVTCPATVLAPGASMVCTADPYTVTKADVKRGRITNEASVSGSFCPEGGCQVLSASDTALVTTSTVADEGDDDGDGGGNLAYTGFAGGGNLLLGGGVLGLGLVLLMFGRRRRA